MTYLQKAQQLAEQMLEWFGDKGDGLCLYAKDAEQLIQRPKETYDGAMPSGNAVAGYIFAKMAALTGKEKWLEARDRQLAFLASAARNMPSAHCFGLYAMAEVVYPTMELVCVSAEKQPSGAFRNFLRKEKERGITVLLKNRENAEKMEKISPFTAGYPIPEKGEVYYLCKGATCFEAQHTIEGLKRILGV